MVPSPICRWQAGLFLKEKNTKFALLNGGKCLPYRPLNQSLTKPAIATRVVLARSWAPLKMNRITIILALVTFGCNPQNSGSKSIETETERLEMKSLTLEERKVRVYENLQNLDYSRANKLASNKEIKVSGDKFLYMMKSLALIGVDSIESAKHYLMEFQDLNPDSCERKVSDFVVSWTNEPNFDYDPYLESMIQSMEYNSFDTICFLLDEPATFDVEIEYENE